MSCTSVKGKAALSVELSRTRDSERFPNGAYTISFEMASFDSGNSSAGASWRDKTIVQVTPTELPQVIAVLTGHPREVEFRFHGSQSDKSYKLTPTHLNFRWAGCIKKLTTGTFWLLLMV